MAVSTVLHENSFGEFANGLTIIGGDYPVGRSEIHRVTEICSA